MSRHRQDLLTADPVAARSPGMMRFFYWMARRMMRRDFDGIRISGLHHVRDLPRRPVIAYTNHPSWWDPAFFAVMMSELFPDREAYGPMAVDMLQRYSFMRRIGLFAVEQESRVGAAYFLQTCARILKHDSSILWITPQGRFVDVRSRPIMIEAGIVHLVTRFPRALLLPVAVEYPFWNERTPEALARFGAPLVAESLQGQARSAIREELGHRLEVEMDRLAGDAMAREPARFELLLEGRAGIGGFYDVWGRMRAALAGRRFEPRHDPS